ncbi:interleukin-1 receptor-associated kinase-like 2 [Ornithorhynchus anatinus]|uniref:Interleukin-1 receptor-associated kinase-like 2 n=1 Tax=Ornithorhynchus anatinus TaxID=9258 RepID=A0A6I8PF52_ORNAN|nr:interleukin-1 receptor-associated kinase-like 2 [Ornithorhynchus anatinus]
MAQKEEDAASTPSSYSEGMAPPPSPPRTPSRALYIHQIPAWVLEDFCQKMDSLNDWDWMEFASYVMTDQTQLRKIKSMERIHGFSITRELLWWWGMRLATVQQLLDLLHRLELYRAARVILDWRVIPETANDPQTFPNSTKPGRQSLSPARNGEKSLGNEIEPCSNPAFPNSESVLNGASENYCHRLPPGEDLFHSLRTNPPLSSDLKSGALSRPQQETLLDLNSVSLCWNDGQVSEATNNFSEENKISEGNFADIYKGQRNNAVYVFKKFKETECTSQKMIQRFFHTEVLICCRCCHPNILQLLGFCIGNRFHSLIHPYMLNGSLEERLQCQGGTNPLTWEQRIGICLGLLRAIEYLHGLKIIHGNVKSSNVLLDGNFTPKLGHAGARLCTIDKKSEYMSMKTQIFQVTMAYLPEDFIRVGQLTERVDIFSCGIVLAEALTGIQAVDKGKTPVYLKDLLLGEIQKAHKNTEKLVAKEICNKYLEKKVGLLPEDSAIDFATAICLCLQKKSPALSKVCLTLEAAERRTRGQGGPNKSEHSTLEGSLVNLPEETDDVDNLSTEESSSDGYNRGSFQAGAASLSSKGDACPGPSHLQNASGTSWEIEINAAKKKMMEDILLYKEEKLNSSELFGAY